MSSPQLALGQWGLFTGPEGKQLVLLDGEPVGPISARKASEETLRRLLLDDERVQDAHLREQDDIVEFVEHGGEQLRVEVRQIVSPWSKTIVGVLAGVWRADDAAPEPPLVGSWEWVVALSDGKITGRKTYWNKNLFDLYEVDSEVARRSGYWEVDVWASDLVAENDSLRFFTSLRDGYWDEWTGVRCATFNAIAGYGTPHRSKKHLRLVAQQGKMSDEHALIFQGFSYAAPEIFADEDLAKEYPTDNALEGLLGLVTDPIAVVDPFSLEVLMTTPEWKANDFGSARSLKQIVADDPEGVRSFMIDASDAGTSLSARTLRIRTAGGARRFRASVVGMDRGPGRDALAIVRLNG